MRPSRSSRVDGGPCAERQRVGRADERRGASLEQLLRGAAGIRHVVGALSRECREIEITAAQSHGAQPARPAVAADIRLRRPRQIPDIGVAVGQEVARHRLGPGAAVDVHPVVGRVGRVGVAAPGPAERHERHVVVDEPGDARVVDGGRGQHHAVDLVRRPHPLVGRDLLVLAPGGEQGEPVVRAMGMLGQLMQEEIADVPVDAVEGGHEPDADGVGPLRPQVPAGAGRNVARGADRGRDPLAGRLGDDRRPIHDVRDRLAGHTELGGQGFQRGSCGQSRTSCCVRLPEATRYRFERSNALRSLWIATRPMSTPSGVQ